MPAAMAACKSRFVAAITRTSVRMDPSSADTLKFVFLQNTQESDLGLGRKLSDLIEEDRASFGQFKAAQTLLSCPCEGALLMAEQF